ncbi:MAG: VOC family protein [Sandaracinaceae bacterium]
MAIQRVFASVLTDRLQASRAFWVDWLGFTVAFDSNWFIQLAAPGDASLELGLIDRHHETIPSAFQLPPTGGLVTVVVDDVDAAHDRALFRDIPVIEPPTDMFYGQRRMLVTSPAGMLVDISSVIQREVTEVEADI